MFNVLEQPWTIVAVSIIFYFVLQIIRQCETNWWISCLLIILFILALSLNRVYGALAPKNKFVVPLAILILLIYEVSLIIRAILMNKKLWWLWIIPIVIAIIGVGLDALVKTNIELIRAVINTGAQAVENEDPDQIDKIIAENYRDSSHRSKDSLITRCRNILSRPMVEKIIPSITSITVESPTAKVLCTSQVSFDSRSYVSQYYMQGMLISTEIELQKQANHQWLISRLEITQINLQPASWSNIQ
ncbi:MAG: hypothetical protein ACYSSP_05915 [Planctomycetota bacterium]|jgi:hypothetical protein